MMGMMAPLQLQLVLMTGMMMHRQMCCSHQGPRTNKANRDADADVDGGADVDSRTVDKGNESDEDRGSSNAIGDEVEVAGLVWKGAASMGDDKRGGRPKSKMEMRKLKVNSHTRASGFWKELLPVPVERVLEVVKENAKPHRDNSKCDEGGLMGWFCCLCGGCQFKPGTEAWASEKKGMMPGPNFGGFISNDKFERWMRHASEGPKGVTDEGPWGTSRWLVKGHNDNRKKALKPSWLVAVDEATWAWTGQGMPHLSSVPREPEPLGAEIKNLC
jgi:hypothetical protein